MRLIFAALLTAALPGFALAAGEESSPPKPTKTTKECWGKRVWSEEKQRCVRVKKTTDEEQSSLSDDVLYQAVRELAYAGRISDAQAVLTAMSDQQDDRVLTYWGFTHRKMGNLDTAMVYYTAAISKNPDNFLARSYMAQGFVEQGDLDEARIQLAEIESRGGAYQWPATSLRQAIYRGKTLDY